MLGVPDWYVRLDRLVVGGRQLRSVPLKGLGLWCWLRQTRSKQPEPYVIE